MSYEPEIIEFERGLVERGPDGEPEYSYVFYVSDPKGPEGFEIIMRASGESAEWFVERIRDRCRNPVVIPGIPREDE
jgi:hypothetical protein